MKNKKKKWIACLCWQTVIPVRGCLVRVTKRHGRSSRDGSLPNTLHQQQTRCIFGVPAIWLHLFFLFTGPQKVTSCNALGLAQEFSSTKKSLWFQGWNVVGWKTGKKNQSKKKKKKKKSNKKKAKNQEGETEVFGFSWNHWEKNLGRFLSRKMHFRKQNKAKPHREQTTNKQEQKCHRPPRKKDQTKSTDSQSAPADDWQVRRDVILQLVTS